MKRLIRSKNTYLILVTELIALVLLFSSFSAKSELYSTLTYNEKRLPDAHADSLIIVPAADLMNAYLPYLQGKKIAVVANQTSIVKKGSLSSKIEYTHLIDTLLSHDITIQKVFAPEHGFRGRMDAGEKVDDDKDIKTGLTIISLYGKNKKPTAAQLKDVDLVLFDIQDVGVRFYTYISTMSLVMEACAESEIPLVILDRPNPNGHYIDGPVLESEHNSFLGMHEVPLVYGMTMGEYAKMVNGEFWLKDSVVCQLKIIPILNYTHQSKYSLPVRPSPNLPNDRSVNLYPSLGFFEGTIINAGRGTEFQFQRYGAPFFPATEFSYTPEENFGSKYPKFKGEKCYGVDLTDADNQNQVNLEWLLDAFSKTPEDRSFFGKTFTAHAGNEMLRKQIEKGLTSEEIRKSWTESIENFKLIREKYLIYP
ncbi:exo-beta-N-acetylmuramidase NamZ family protein [Lutimonas zeaxanthinifaciens]|uniref:exo-beta-N-acetylmuramidase NamZ family protein n=1 Tax=Lutimonas zeaxanthinifaciens TaxID=3060215 RepID=UPI00265D384A|nr:DUF1343 domain-containing protein [Lutimonas sp. YSD2104]WKK66870.1 DUF1343 domain-containing protein [Lutimonas sp. YSD2104]